MLMRRALCGRRFRVALFVALLFGCAGTLEVIARFYGADIGILPSAAQAWWWNMDAQTVSSARLYALVFIYVVAAFAFADDFSSLAHEGGISYLRVRTDRRHLITVYGVVSFAAGFTVTLVPLLVFQVVALLAFPVSGGMEQGLYTPVFEYFSADGMPLKEVYFTCPYLYNVLVALYAAACAGTAALFSFSLSLTVCKHRLIADCIPAVASIAVFEIVQLVSIDGYDLIPLFYLYPRIQAQTWSVVGLTWFPALMLGASLFLIGRARRDSLVGSGV